TNLANHNRVTYIACVNIEIEWILLFHGWHRSFPYASAAGVLPWHQPCCAHALYAVTARPMIPTIGLRCAAAGTFAVSNVSTRVAASVSNQV
ncbi:hypothetical protein, partial [Escherichia coli]|uniref:hypothetical protein n=1 Tax=Escherichia coli TaxID=562 RepID=UPI001BE7A324